MGDQEPLILADHRPQQPGELVGREIGDALDGEPADLLALLTVEVGTVRRPDELRGQEENLASPVEGGRVVVTALGEREEKLSRIVRASRVTLQAIASRRATRLGAGRGAASARNRSADARPLASAAARGAAT